MAEPREDIAYLSDLDGLVERPSSFTPGNFAAISSAAGGSIVDSGKSPGDYYTKTQADTKIGSVQWTVLSQMAAKAYDSAAWAPNTSYGAGSFCMYSGQGYRLKDGSSHVSGDTFDSSKWELVLNSNGKEALDGFVSRISTPKANLTDLAPVFDSSLSYATGQLVVYNNTLKRCTTAHSGAWNDSDFANATIEDVLESMKNEGFDAYVPIRGGVMTGGLGTPSLLVGTTEAGVGLIPSSSSPLAFAIWRGGSSDTLFIPDSEGTLVVQEAFAPAFGVGSHALGDLCSYGGLIYRCVSPYTSTSSSESPGADDTHWERVGLSDILPAAAQGLSPEAIDDQYNSTAPYSAGDTCMYEGRWYRALANMAAGAFNPSNWEEITVKGVVSTGEMQVQADWDEEDSTDPAYIRNKPDISGSGSGTGGSVDWDDITNKPSLNYSFYSVPIGNSQSDSNTLVGTLKDRAVNAVQLASVDDGKTIRLTLPSVSGNELRDFYLTLNVTGSGDVPVYVGGAHEDPWGEAITALAAHSGKIETYHFTEVTSSGNVFMVTGASDPAYRALQEVERALDDILGTIGGAAFAPGLYAYNESDGKYYRVTATTDPDMGVVLTVDQEGVAAPGQADSSSDSSSS